MEPRNRMTLHYLKMSKTLQWLGETDLKLFRQFNSRKLTLLKNKTEFKSVVQAEQYYSDKYNFLYAIYMRIFKLYMQFLIFKKSIENCDTHNS